MAKHKDGTYHKGYFCGGSNINIILITSKDKTVIPSKLQSYVLHWYHMYLLISGMNRMETIIFQHVYWPGMIYSIHK